MPGAGGTFLVERSLKAGTIETVKSRQRFLETMCGGKPDRPPLFPEGIREEVLQEWRAQGLPPRTRLETLFTYDDFEELAPEIYPLPEITDWSDRAKVLEQLRQRLNPDDPRRFPRDWAKEVSRWQHRQHPLFLRIHQGFFQCLGVEGWNSFEDVIYLLYDDPAFVRYVMQTQADFAARLAENILREVTVDAVIFSEPIAGMSGSLISPAMYRDFVLSSYAPIFSVLQRFGVPVVIWRSYANPRALIPEVTRSAFNAIWICETDPNLINYSEIRAELGEDLGLIGGVDTDVLREGTLAIRRAVEAVLPLVEQGRMIPLADGRVREFIPFENYAYYRRVLEEQFLERS